jgi:mono/diheme cytochrome c family protein
MRLLIICLLAGCAAPLIDEATDIIIPEYSASDFAVCAACHLDNGSGIPGTFPPLRSRSTKMAALEGGHEYLITVVSFGLMGTIQAEGQSYFGVMPGHAGSMQADAIAAALNYLVFGLNDDAKVGNTVKPFSARDVNAVQANTVGGDPMTAGQLRNTLRARHGEKWPH